MGSVAQMEQELIVEHTRAGLAAARQRGRTGGRRRSMTDSKIESAKKLLSFGVPARGIAATSASLSRLSIDGFLRPQTLNVLCNPSREVTSLMGSLHDSSSWYKRYFSFRIAGKERKSTG